MSYLAPPILLNGIQILSLLPFANSKPNENGVEQVINVYTVTFIQLPCKLLSHGNKYQVILSSRQDWVCKFHREVFAKQHDNRYAGMTIFRVLVGA